MKTGAEYAAQAKSSAYNKLKYSQVDCQAFCELVLSDIGVKQPDGRAYNWKGSNDMARHAVSWIGTKDECRKQFGSIPPGSWAFIWENKTGNEKTRGYSDGLGNYSHIGIYVGGDIVRDSTRWKNSSGEYVRDGVADRALSAFNRIGLCKYLDFGTESSYNDSAGVAQIISEIRDRLNELERKVLHES